MTLYEWFTVIGILGGLVLGLYNYFDKRRGTDQNDFVTRANYLRTTNEAIELSNERALAAEKRASDVETRLVLLEQKLSYRLTFDVLLGSDPVVEHVEITHFPERRREARVKVESPSE